MMLKRTKTTGSSHSSPACNDTKVDRMLETLAGSARPDLSRLRRGVERRLASDYGHTRPPARLEPKRRVWAFALAAVSVLGLILILATRNSSPPAIILLALGDTTVIENGRGQAVSQSEPISLGSTIQSKKGGMLTLLLSDLSRIRVAKSTSVRLVGRADLSLEYGSLFAEVTPLDDTAGRFLVRAGEVLVTVLAPVLGTSFEVSCSGGVADVTVEKGVVEVSANNSRVLVSEGQTVRFNNGDLLNPRQIDPASIATWRRRLQQAEANDPTFLRLMQTYFPSRSLDAARM